MSDIQNVLIVGGSVAGLTVANALSRVGVHCEVIERSEHTTGAAITLLNRAVDGLQEIGVLDQFLSEGLPRSPEEVFRYLDAAGEVVPTPPMPPRPEAALPLGIVIYRPTMTRILREAARHNGVSVRIGTCLSRLAQTEHDVTAEFSDGSRRTYDLVIGADGVRSTTRELVFGDAVAPQYSGTTMFRWVVDGVPDVGPVGFYQSETLIVTLRLRDGRLYIAAGRNFDERPRIDQPTARAMLRENLRTFSAPLMRELDRRLTDDVQLIVNDYDWLLMPEQWHRGRVILIGDAAHATTAHLASGGGMAIEDAVVLGQELAAGGSPNEIFTRFTKRRYDRTRLVVETSVEIGRMEQAGRPIAEQNAKRGIAMGELARPY